MSSSNEASLFTRVTHFVLTVAACVVVSACIAAPATAWAQNDEPGGLDRVRLSSMPPHQTAGFSLVFLDDSDAAVELGAGYFLFYSAVVRGGWRAPLWNGRSADGSGWELGLPVLVGARYVYASSDSQPVCIMGPCPGYQTHRFMGNLYAGFDTVYWFDRDIGVDVEIGGGYNIQLFDRADALYGETEIPEVQLAVGLAF